jgi:hypothetical protein
MFSKYAQRSFMGDEMLEELPLVRQFALRLGLDPIQED